MRAFKQPATIQFLVRDLGLHGAKCRQTGVKPAAVGAQHRAQGVQGRRRPVAGGKAFSNEGVHFLNLGSPSIKAP